MMYYPIQVIFQKYYLSYCEQYGVNFDFDKVARAIISCKTSSQGGHSSICVDCGYSSNHYNSCRNRHCPCCQGVVKAKWIDKRKAEVLNAPYFHVVFTVPSELRPLFFSNKNELYSLLYRISKETLMTLAKDPKYLGVDIGFMSILHTFGQNLSYHPHLHCVVLGGGFTKDLKFKKSDDKFLFPVRVISKLFRGKFLAALKELYKNKKLIFSSEMKCLYNSKAFNDFLSLLYSKEWIPHIKETFKGAKNVIEYLGNYTHRIAISNARILNVTDLEVTFKAKNYRTGEKETVTLHPVEFIRRFLMHVLPKGFTKIRHYGILSNRSKKVKLAICRNILKGIYHKSELNGLSMPEILLKLFNIDILSCKKCGSKKIHKDVLFVQLE